MPSSRQGYLAAVAAYVLWGLLPLFWPLLEPAAPVEILAHRVAWSLVFLAVLVALTTGLSRIRGLGRRRLALLALAAALITGNWGIFIYAVNSGQVVETSLGYFINPLVTVLLAVTVLGERLRRPQIVAVAIAAAGVLVLTADHGRPPWIALALAGSFACYGLIKKRVAVDGVTSLTVETAVAVLPAVAYLAWLEAGGRGTLVSEGAGHLALLAAAGLVTAVPLVLFGAAAVRIPLASVGLLQYIAPVLQFAIGVLVLAEPMPLGRLAGFLLVWAALAVFMWDAVRVLRAGARLAPPAPDSEAGAVAPVLSR